MAPSLYFWHRGISIAGHHHIIVPYHWNTMPLRHRSIRISRHRNTATPRHASTAPSRWRGTAPLGTSQHLDTTCSRHHDRAVSCHPGTSIFKQRGSARRSSGGSDGVKEARSPMRSIAWLSEKGGTGKTTSAVNTAACLAKLGRRVLVIDADPQGNT